MISHRMACGNCAGTKFEVIFIEMGVDHASPNYPNQLNIVCVNCGSTTNVTIPSPHMKISIAAGSKGCLCILED